MGALHQNIGSNCLRYDQRSMGDVVFLVTIRDTRGRPEALSVLRISTLSSESGSLSLMHKVSTKLTSKKAFVKGNCRRDKGDFGGMMVIGQACKQSTNILCLTLYSGENERRQQDIYGVVYTLISWSKHTLGWTDYSAWNIIPHFEKRGTHGWMVLGSKFQDN